MRRLNRCPQKKKPLSRLTTRRPGAIGKRLSSYCFDCNRFRVDGTAGQRQPEDLLENAAAAAASRRTLRATCDVQDSRLCTQASLERFPDSLWQSLLQLIEIIIAIKENPGRTIDHSRSHQCRFLRWYYGTSTVEQILRASSCVLRSHSLCGRISC